MTYDRMLYALFVWFMSMICSCLTLGCREKTNNAANSHVDNQPTKVINVRYAERLRRSITVDSQGNLVLSDPQGVNTAVTVTGTITKIISPHLAQTPSVVTESKAQVRLQNPLSIADKQYEEIQLYYDVNALLFGSMHEGDILAFEFDHKGNLIDVWPVINDEEKKKD